MDVIARIKEAARALGKTLCLPESHDPRDEDRERCR
jgi:hypothetical protein